MVNLPYTADANSQPKAVNPLVAGFVGARGRAKFFKSGPVGNTEAAQVSRIHLGMPAE